MMKDLRLNFQNKCILKFSVMVRKRFSEIWVFGLLWKENIRTIVSCKFMVDKWSKFIFEQLIIRTKMFLNYTLFFVTPQLSVSLSVNILSYPF